MNLSKDKKYLLGLSMGSDSLSLFSMLQKEGYVFSCAIVNYHFRKEADDEVNLAKEICKKYNIDIYIKDSYFKKGNFEDFARNERYDFFKELVDKYHFDEVLIAHNKDDLIETYLLQEKRGIVSYYGLLEETYIKGCKIKRPLLNYYKDELEQYCKDNNLPYCIDKTNFDTKYQRNKIRSELKLLSKEEKEKIVNVIKEKNNRLIEDNALIEKIIDNNKVELKVLDTLNEDQKVRLLYQFIKKYNQNYILKTSLAKEILSQINKTQGNKSFSLGEGLLIVKLYDCLRIVKIENYNYTVEVDRPSIVENRFIYFDLTKKLNLFYLNDDSFPLKIENVKGDEIIYLGKVKKKINRLFIDEKIDYIKRLYWPKIIDRHGKIVFVPRTTKNQNNNFVVKDLDGVI